jgi:hypothetical protein
MLEISSTNKIIGTTYSTVNPDIYTQFKNDNDAEVFEKLVLDLMLNKYSDDKELTDYILSLPRDIKRMAVLSLIDGDNVLWSKMNSFVNGCADKFEHIKDVIKIINQFVKDGEVERKKYGEVMTPITLVREMLDTLPKEVWSNPKLKWLDPANGAGTFPFVVVYKLMVGLKDWQPDVELRYKHIVENMIYTCELQSRNVFLWLCGIDPKDEYTTNTYWGSFLDDAFDYHMKNVWGVENFDIIIGNPPYQDENKSQVKLWPLFINKSINFLNDGGSLLKVFPSVWINRPGGQKFKKTTELFSIYQLEKVVIENKDGKKWFDIGETVCFIHFIKNKNSKDTVFIEGDKTLSIKYTAERIILDEREKLLNNIIDKVNNICLKNGKYEWHEDLHHNDSKETMLSDGRLKTVREPNDVIIWYTASQMFYTNMNNISNDWRVIINLSGYYYKEELVSKYMKITNSEGCTSGMRSILCDSEESAKNLFTVLSSSLYRFYNDFQKTSGFNTFVFNFPKLENKKWTNAEVYNYFGLTKEEVLLVENFISEK